MLSILRKATASMMKGGRSSMAEQFDAVDDLSTWEIVNASLSDDEDLFSFDGDDVISDKPKAHLEEEEEEGEEEGGEEEEEEEEEEAEEEGEGEEEEDAGVSLDLGPPDEVIFVPPPMTFKPDVIYHHVYDDGHGHDDDSDHRYGDDEEEEEEDMMYDDELVMWKVKERFGKRRMNKMGKRGGLKLSKWKRTQYY